MRGLLSAAQAGSRRYLCRHALREEACSRFASTAVSIEAATLFPVTAELRL